MQPGPGTSRCESIFRSRGGKDYCGIFQDGSLLLPAMYTAVIPDFSLSGEGRDRYLSVYSFLYVVFKIASVIYESFYLHPMRRKSIQDKNLCP